MTTVSKLPYLDMVEMALALESHHALFARVWDWASIELLHDQAPDAPDYIATTSLVVDKFSKQHRVLINDDWWENTNAYTRKFHIAHLATHAALGHSARIQKLCSKEELILGDVAADIVVNHLLTNRFSFKREHVVNQDQLAWIDTVFPEPEKIEPNRSLEYYLQKLRDEPEANLEHGESDTHSDAGDDEGDEGRGDDKPDGQDLIEKLCDSLTDDMSKTDADQLVRDLEEITERPPPKKVEPNPPFEALLKLLVKLKHTPKKKKWETVIKEWTEYHESERDEYQWAQEDRRFATLPKSDVRFPQMATVIEKNYEKINIFFFLDISGSCQSYRNRFFTAAASLDPQKFNVRLFGRDTEVYECRLDNARTFEFRGTGDDDFACMERFIQQELRDNKIKKYPDGVFHITDGVDCRGKVMPCEKPKNWHWFLVGDRSTHWIPGGSNIYNLSDFE